MAESFVRLNPDGSGKRMKTFISGTDPAVEHHVQAVKETHLDRQQLQLFVNDVSAVATTETLLSFTPVLDGVTGSATTSYAVPSGKKIRIQTIAYTVYNSSAAANRCRYALRRNPSGAVATNSPVLDTQSVGTLAAVANATQSHPKSWPFGLDIVAGQFGMSYNAAANTARLEVCITGFIYTP